MLGLKTVFPCSRRTYLPFSDEGCSVFLPMGLPFLADRRYSSTGKKIENNPLEMELLYEQKPDNNYFANKKKAPTMYKTSFLCPRNVSPLYLSLPWFRGILQHFAARPEELQNRELPGSRGCSCLFESEKTVYN